VGTRRCPLSICKPSTKSPSSASNSPTSHGVTTRNNNEGRKVIALDYEAYPEMAEKELTRLGEEARRKWQICRTAIVYRVGPGQITEPSVMIAVSAAHREAAFAACRFAIEEIKKTVPIWKKEVYEGGEIWIGTQSGQPLNRS
jgi:molybdopterin synthase catalytic subunit